MSGYDESNIFARILRGEIPSQKIYEDEAALAIMDVMPESKGHCLVIPKAASRNLLDADDATLAAAIRVVRKLAAAVKQAFAADGVVVRQFNEAASGQTVFHLHFHVIPVYEGVALKRHAGGMADPALLGEQAAAIRAAIE